MLRPTYHFHHLPQAVPTLMGLDRLRGVLVDLDNTVVPYHGHEAPPEVARAVAALKQRYAVALISNNRSKRVNEVGAALDIPCIPNAMKPFPSGFRRGMAILGSAPCDTAFIGDQLFTDVLGANRLGMVTVLVNPLGGKDFPATKIMRAMETVALGLLGISRRRVAEEAPALEHAP